MGIMRKASAVLRLGRSEKKEKVEEKVEEKQVVRGLVKLVRSLFAKGARLKEGAGRSYAVLLRSW